MSTRSDFYQLQGQQEPAETHPTVTLFIQLLAVFVKGTKMRHEDPEGVHVHAYTRGHTFLGRVG